jgi:threonine dehydrogenase-like Zn-dependent dehydrogenase
MRAVAAFSGLTSPGWVDIPEPSAPGVGEALCRTLQIGVCGTDREILQSAAPLTPDGSDFLVLGHECLARVEEVGPEVAALRPGDLVTPLVRRPIRESPVRPDLLAFGDYVERGIVRQHGFAMSRFVDRQEHLLRVDPSLAKVAVLAEPVSVAEKAGNEASLVARARYGDHWISQPPRTLVVGMGPIGFAGLIACRCRAWPMTMAGRDDPESSRANAARDLGADYVQMDDDWSPRLVESDGFDLILECTGNDAVAMRAAEWLASRGILCWLGSSRQPRPDHHNVDLLIRNAILRNHVFIGCVNSARRDFDDALRHLSELSSARPAALEAIITSRAAPDDALWHFQNRTPQGIKAVIVFSE